VHAHAVFVHKVWSNQYCVLSPSAPLSTSSLPDGECLCRYAEAEKTNGRWAMMAVAGIMGQELLGVTPKWFEAGGKSYAIDTLPLLALEFIAMGFLETKRYQGFKNTGSVRLS
jgi:light-harvesting complex I chlorophyll a/b binding protein 5